jgi:hypothetical protein
MFCADLQVKLSFKSIKQFWKDEKTRLSNIWYDGRLWWCPKIMYEVIFELHGTEFLGRVIATQLV